MVPLHELGLARWNILLERERAAEMNLEVGLVASEEVSAILQNKKTESCVHISSAPYVRVTANIETLNDLVFFPMSVYSTMSFRGETSNSRQPLY